MADRALVGVGRDDRHLAHPLERLLEREQPARFDAVVVGDQDLGPGRPLPERSGVLAQRARAAPRRATGQRLAALLVEVAPLGPGPLAGHVRLVGPALRRASVVVAHGCVLVGDPGSSGSAVSAGVVGLARGRPARRAPARRCRSRCRGSARAGCGPVARHVPRDGAPPARRPSDRPRSDAGTRGRTPTRPRRSGSRRSRRGCRRSGRRSAPSRGPRSGGCRRRPA